MKDFNLISRRAAIKSSIFGTLAVSIPSLVFSKEIIGTNPARAGEGAPHPGYPAIDDEIVSEVVGASHFNLDRVKELVNRRPELARAAWDWGFGDWESAIGAASHVGRRDIVLYLLEKGARPNIFTYATLGAYDAVKAMVEASPDVQAIAGPHGISLLQHAKSSLRMQDLLTDKNKENANKLIAYLEDLGNADVQEKYLELEETAKEKYLGDYKYGDGSMDGFTVGLNMRKLLSLGRIGEFGGALYQKGENVFAYNGTPSVEITFEVQNGRVLSLTVHEPDLVLTAKKV